MPGAQWLELLCRHIPDRFEHLVWYVGWYSTRVRGEQARKAVPGAAVQAPEDGQVIAARARSAWARLIHKVYEVDPLECPKCGAPMQVIALIDGAEVIRRILEHLAREDYNHHRPHSSLGHLTPIEFAKQGQGTASGTAKL